MRCLYQSDYGPADPAFDPFAEHGELLKGFEAHTYALSQAQNRGQLEAMKRQLQRGETLHWCDQGYGWTSAPLTADFFYVAFALIIVPWLLLRVLPRLRRRALAAPILEARSEP